MGRTISHYRVIGRLGAGGMGVVYTAEDVRLHRLVALKFLSAALASDPEALARFKLEARAASTLNHPNICTIYDVGEEAGAAFIAMEFVDGATLAEGVAKGPLDVATLIRLSLEILDGLQTAHGAGIVHRDIKPANVLVTSRGHAKILDFGLAKVHPAAPGAQEALTRVSTASPAAGVTVPGSVFGTLSYMSPEQVRGEAVDARSDLFSFGAVLYEMATSTRAFAAATPGLVFDGILNRDPQPASRLNPHLPAGLDLIIQKCLAKDPERRYQRAADVAADLGRVAREPATGPEMLPASGTTRRHRARWPLVAAGAGVVVAGLVGAFFFAPRTPALTERDTIVVAEFENRTSDPVFDGMLREGLVIQLRQSPFLSLVSDERVRQQLRLMGRSTEEPLSSELARDVCERNGSTAVVEGSIQALGRQYVLALRARNCATGDVIHDEQAQSPSKEEVLDVLSRMASALRTGVGESLASVQRHSVALPDATTRSTDALKAYSSAVRAFQSSGPAASLPLLERAVSLDPEFAMAHALMGITYSNLGESVLSSEHTARAYELRERASDRERFFITAMYHRQVTGNLERDQETLESWARTYPRDIEPHGLLAGLCTQGTGRFELSIAAAKRAMALDPAFALPYLDSAFSYLYLGRLTDAAWALDQAARRRLDRPELPMGRYFVALLKGDQAAMEREVAQAKEKAGLEDWMSHADALVLARSARLADARQASRVAVQLAQEAGKRERAAMFEAGRAVSEGFFGNAAAATERALAALSLSDGRDVQFAAAFALALAGNRPRVRTLTDDLERRYPEDTSVRFNYLPALRGLSALNAGKAEAALDLLQPATRFDFAVPGIAFNGFFGALYPVYVRGLALLQAHRPREAAVEFEKILQHRGIVLADPVDARARLECARALTLAGDSGRAKAAYRDLLDLWSSADQGLSPVKQARLEYGRLR